MSSEGIYCVWSVWCCWVDLKHPGCACACTYSVGVKDRAVLVFSRIAMLGDIERPLRARPRAELKYAGPEGEGPRPAGRPAGAARPARYLPLAPRPAPLPSPAPRATARHLARIHLDQRPFQRRAHTRESREETGESREIEVTGLSFLRGERRKTEDRRVCHAGTGV